MNYFAIAENESKARIRFNFLEKMIQPCGPPPEKKAEDRGKIKSLFCIHDLKK